MIPTLRTNCVLNEFPRSCLIPFPPTILEAQRIMKTNLSFSTPAEVETECLVAIVLDKAEKGKGEKDKPQLSIETSEAAMKDAAADVISGGEVTGKTFEATLLHHPAKLKAKRLLLLGGGKAKSFSAFELRRLAGAAVRTLKSRGLRSFAILAPEAGRKWKTRSRPSWKAHSSATSIRTTTRAIARIRRSTHSPWLPAAIKPNCSRRWTMPASSVNRRISLATWSMSPPIA